MVFKSIVHASLSDPSPALTSLDIIGSDERDIPTFLPLAAYLMRFTFPVFWPIFPVVDDFVSLDPTCPMLKNSTFLEHLAMNCFEMEIASWMPKVLAFVTATLKTLTILSNGYFSNPMNDVLDAIQDGVKTQTRLEWIELVHGDEVEPADEWDNFITAMKKRWIEVRIKLESLE